MRSICRPQKRVSMDSYILHELQGSICVGFRDKEGSKDSPNSPFSDAHPPDFLRREDSKLDRLHLFHRRLRVVGVDGRHDAAHQRPTLEKDSKVISCRGLKSSLVPIWSHRKFLKPVLLSQVIKWLTLDSGCTDF